MRTCSIGPHDGKNPEKARRKKGSLQRGSLSRFGHHKIAIGFIFELPPVPQGASKGAVRLLKTWDDRQLGRTVEPEESDLKAPLRNAGLFLDDAR
jgi:hypothetical protein